MHIIIDGEEGLRELFDAATTKDIALRITGELQDYRVKLKAEKIKLKPYFIGACILHDVQLKAGGVIKLWAEYNARVLPGGLIDFGMHKCIAFDEMPDTVLDNYNYFKQLAAQYPNVKGKQ
jgi:hypothetical protein